MFKEFRKNKIGMAEAIRSNLTIMPRSALKHVAKKYMPVKRKTYAEAVKRHNNTALKEIAEDLIK